MISRARYQSKVSKRLKTLETLRVLNKNLFSSGNVFHVSLIYGCLNSFSERHNKQHNKDLDNLYTKELIGIRTKAKKFLIREKSPQCSWNYFSRSGKNKNMYPDDLDDTACTLISLYKHDKKLIAGKDISQFVQTLVDCEEKPGGPYNTWIQSPKNKWKDIDVVVNANIASLLALYDVDLPNLTKFIHKAVRTNNFPSLYYEHPLTHIYFISRFYSYLKHKDRETKECIKILIRKIKQLSKPKVLWKKPLWNALAITSLLNLGVDTKEKELALAIKNILSNMGDDGLWEATGLYKEKIQNGTTHYSGSRPLTTVFVMEAIFLYENALQKEYEPDNANIEKICQEVRTILIKKINTFPSIFKNPSLKILSELERKKLDYFIAPSTYIFTQNMCDIYKSKIDHTKHTYKTVINLGAANIFGWMGYTIQDDIMDKDSTADSELLPLSNFLIRKSFEIFEKETVSIAGKNTVQNVFNIMDRANALELQIRKKDDMYTKNNRMIIAEKSYGHVLGPLIIMLRAGMDPLSKRYKALETFFMEYLFVRQMNDDAHDWEKDIDKGQENYVYKKLIKHYFKKEYFTNKLPKRSWNKPIYRNKLKTFFWENHLEKVHNEIKLHIKKAEKAYDASGIFKDMTYANILLKPIKISINKAIFERDQMRNFLDSQ